MRFCWPASWTRRTRRSLRNISTGFVTQKAPDVTASGAFCCRAPPPGPGSTHPNHVPRLPNHRQLLPKPRQSFPNVRQPLPKHKPCLRSPTKRFRTMNLGAEAQTFSPNHKPLLARVCDALPAGIEPGARALNRLEAGNARVRDANPVGSASQTRASFACPDQALCRLTNPCARDQAVFP